MRQHQNPRSISGGLIYLFVWLRTTNGHDKECVPCWVQCCGTSSPWCPWLVPPLWTWWSRSLSSCWFCSPWEAQLTLTVDTLSTNAENNVRSVYLCSWFKKKCDSNGPQLQLTVKSGNIRNIHTSPKEPKYSLTFSSGVSGERPPTKIFFTGSLLFMALAFLGSMTFPLSLCSLCVTTCVTK